MLVGYACVLYAVLYAALYAVRGILRCIEHIDYCLGGDMVGVIYGWDMVGRVVSSCCCLQ